MIYLIDGTTTITVDGTREELEAATIEAGLVGPDEETQYQSFDEFLESTDMYIRNELVEDEVLTPTELANRWA